MEELSHELEWKKNEGEPLTKWIAITVVCEAVSLALYVLDRGGFNPENINRCDRHKFENNLDSWQWLRFFHL